MDEINNGKGIQQTQETNEPKKPLGMLKDPSGDYSSGRFIKVFSFFVACILAGFLCFSLLTSTKEKPSDPNVINAIVISIATFLTVATGAEITQKLTKL